MTLNCPVCPVWHGSVQLCSLLPSPAGTGWCVSAGPSIQTAGHLFQSWCPSRATSWQTERRRWAASTHPVCIIPLSLSETSSSFSSITTCWSRQTATTRTRRPFLHWRRRTRTKQPTNTLQHFRPQGAKSIRMSWRRLQRRRSSWSFLMPSDANAETILSYILTYILTVVVLSWHDVSDIECSGLNVDTVRVYDGDFTFFCNIFNPKFYFFCHDVLRTNKLWKSFYFQIYQIIYK